MASPVNTNPAERADLVARFHELTQQWKADTAYVSSTTAMIAHPAYQAIVALGQDVVPLILQDLEDESAHWFEALQATTGEDPVPPKDWGRIPAMRSAWLDWGRERGLI
jgi:hypothetical protein